MSKPPPVPDDETSVFVDDTYLGRLAYRETKKPGETKTVPDQQAGYLPEEDPGDA